MFANDFVLAKEDSGAKWDYVKLVKFALVDTAPKNSQPILSLEIDA